MVAPTMLPQPQVDHSLEELPKHQSSWFLNVILGISIIGIGVMASIFILTGGKSSSNTGAISPTPIAISSNLVSEYDNPFDAKTQYVNPFAENINPFDGFAQ